jgi:hypothetical protein
MKKAQMKIQEMAFVLLALVLLAIIGFIFFLKLSQNKLVESATDIKTQTTLSLLEKLANLPELECYCKPSCKANCMDKDKVNSLKTMLQTNKNLESLFQGLSSLKVKQIYPPENEIVIYTSRTPSNASSYQTFINLCQYDTGRYSYDCNMAMIIAKGVS